MKLEANKIFEIRNISLKNVLLFSFLFFIPIMLNDPDKPLLPAPLGGKVQLSDVIFIFMFLYMLYDRMVNKIEIRYSTMIKFLILYLLLLSISFISTINFLNTFVEIAGVIYLILVFFTLHNMLRTKDDLIVAIYAIITSLAIISIIGVVGIILSGFIGLENPFASTAKALNVASSLKAFFGDSIRLPRVEASLKPTSSMLGAYLTMTIGFLFAFYKSRGGQLKKFMLAIIIAVMVLAFFTFSRTLLAFITAVYIIVKFSGRPSLRILSRFLLAFAVLLFVVFNAMSIWHVEKIEFQRSAVDNSNHKTRWVLSDVRGRYGEPLYFYKNENRPNSLVLGINYAYDYYFVLKWAAVEMFRRSPIWGVGLGNFSGMTGLMHNEGLLPEGVSKLEGAHSTIFNLFAETGIPGVIGFVILSVLLLRMLYRSFRLTREGFSRDIILGILAGYIGMLIVSVDLVIVNFRFIWANLAIAFAIYENIEPRATRLIRT